MVVQSELSLTLENKKSIKYYYVLLMHALYIDPDIDIFIL